MACRAEASSEGGMNADAHGFFSREGREDGEENCHLRALCVLRATQKTS